MVLFRVIPTEFEETARKISKELALLSHDQWAEVQFEASLGRARIPLLYVPYAHDPTTTFRDALNKSIV